MRYVGDLISIVREQTENEVTPGITGISDNVILEYLNRAQEQLQAVILRAIPDYSGFDTSYEVAPTVNSPYVYLPQHPSYSASIRNPGAVYGGGQVRKVEFSQNGQPNQYSALKRRYHRLLSNDYSWPPYEYDVLGNKIQLGPCPSSTTGKARVTYIMRPARLALRSCLVASVTASATHLQTIVISDLDAAVGISQAVGDYICVVDNAGNAISNNIPISGYDAGTSTLTVLTNSRPISEFEYHPDNFMAGFSIVVGKYTTTHPQILDEGERFLIEYAILRVFRKDSSTDAADQANEVGNAEQAIVEGLMHERERDILEVPITDESWFN